MAMPLIRRAAARAAVMIAVALPGGVAAQGPGPGGTLFFDTLPIAGTPYTAEWHLPAAPAQGLAVVAHGFMRQCAHLRGTLHALMARGIVVLCINAPMARGNPALAIALAELIAAGPAMPDGRVPPPAVVVGGHSAGAQFALHLGARLVQVAPGRLRGALLFDPVAAGSGFAQALHAVAGGDERPVLSILAAAAPCNAGGHAVGPLRALRSGARDAGRDGFVGLQLLQGSTHLDAEGDDTDGLGVLACGGGRPQAANVGLLRELAAQWAADLLAGTRTAAAYPGGQRVDDAVARGAVRPIE